MSVYKELLEVLGVERDPKESVQEHLATIVDAADGVEDSVWEELSTDAQNWINAAVDAREAEEDIVSPDGFKDKRSSGTSSGNGKKAKPEPEKAAKPEKSSKKAKAKAVEEDEDEPEADEDEEEDEPAPKSKKAAKPVKAKAEPEKPAKAAKPDKKAKAEPEKAAKPEKSNGKKAAKPEKGNGKKSPAEGRGRPSKYTDSQKVTVLTKTNPYREGSLAAETFSKFKTGMTIEACRKAGAAGLIKFAEAKGFLKVA